MKDFLALVGICTLIALGFFIIYGLYEVIKELIDRAKRKHTYKHRFDKPPTAECYCKDCKRHSDENQRCYKFDGWYTADNWFCWAAEPRDNICP